MIKRIVNLVTAVTLGLLLFNVVALNTPIYADSAQGSSYGLFADSAGDACNGLSQLGGETCGQGQSKINKASARTALVYALIGIAVAALAQVLVHFALNQASGG